MTMGDLSFDDLIPSGGQSSAAGAGNDVSFDDLVPSSKPKGGSALEAFGSKYLDVPTMGGATALRAELGVLAGNAREAMGLQRGNLGKTYPEEFQRVSGKQEAAQEAHPIAADIGTGGGLVAAGVATPARLATLPAAIAGGAATGAAQRYGETGDTEQAAMGAATGALGSGAGTIAGRVIAPAVTGIGRATGLLSKPITAEQVANQIKAESTNKYQQAKALSARIDPNKLGQLRTDIEDALVNKSGYDPNITGFSDSKSILGSLDRMLAKSATGKPTFQDLNSLEKLRQAVNSTMLSSSERAVRKQGHIINEQIDKFYDNIHNNVTWLSQRTGPQIAQFLKEARPLWMQARKVADLDSAVQRAKDRAASTYSGGNYQNAVRQEFRRIVDRAKKYGSNWSPDEMAAIQKVVDGDITSNLYRGFGKAFAPTGIKGTMETMYGLHGLLSGAMADPLTMLGLAGAGHLAKNAGERATNKAVESALKTASKGKYVGDPLAEAIRNSYGAVGAVGGADLAGQIPVERASGGRVNLVAEAERACKRLGGETRGLMAMRDEDVVNALRLARGGY